MKEIKLKVNYKEIFQNLQITSVIVILFFIGIIIGIYLILSLAGYTDFNIHSEDTSLYIFSLIGSIVFYILFTVLLIYKGFQYANRTITFYEDRLILKNNKKEIVIPFDIIEKAHIANSMFEKFGLKKNLMIMIRENKKRQYRLKKFIFICSERSLEKQGVTIEKLAEEIKLKIKKLK